MKLHDPYHFGLISADTIAYFLGLPPLALAYFRAITIVPDKRTNFLLYLEAMYFTQWIRAVPPSRFRCCVCDADMDPYGSFEVAVMMPADQLANVPLCEPICATCSALPEATKSLGAKKRFGQRIYLAIEEPASRQ